MCLGEFNHFDLELDEKTRLFPVFALHNPLVYVNPSKAEMIAQKLIRNGYYVKVI